MTRLYRNKRRATLALAGWLWLACWCAPVAPAQDDASVLERRVKAAFIFKFAGYVEWPDGTFPTVAAPVTVAVVGDDELAAELAQIAAGRTVEGRSLVVRKTKGVDAAADAHMVFVGRAEMGRLPHLAKLTHARPVLILTDAAGALKLGSMINFMLVEQRVKFEISLDEAERHGLKVSSRLIAVAHNVRRGTP